MRSLTLFILFILPLSVTAALRSSLSGRITDTAGTPLPGAIIELPELHTGDASDSAGRFMVSNLPSGRFLVSVRLLGFASQTLYVNLRGDEIIAVQLLEAPIAQHEDAFGLLNAQGSGVEDKSLHPIVLNEWAARELGASVGDAVRLEYYLWEDAGRLSTRSA